MRVEGKLKDTFLMAPNKPHLNPLQRRGLLTVPYYIYPFFSPSPLERGWGEASIIPLTNEVFVEEDKILIYEV